MAKSKYSEHAGVIAIVIAVTLIFAVSLVTFQVSQTEHAIVLRFGRPTRTMTPGLHMKWPAPIETVWRQDNRIQTFEGKIGVVEEVFTRDAKMINVTVFVNYRIADKTTEGGDANVDYTQRFFTSINNLGAAEDKLTSLMRSYRNGVIGQHDFSDLVNIDPDKVKISALEEEMYKKIRVDALDLYGIEVTGLGMKHIGLPETVTQEVFNRMREDRNREAARIRTEGDAEAERIRAEADRRYSEIIADADLKAKKIRAEGDAEAAKMYDVFRQNPELAEFLRKLDSIDTLSKDDFTLVVDPTIPPFDILRPDTLDRLKLAKPAPAALPTPAPADQK